MLDGPTMIEVMERYMSAAEHADTELLDVNIDGDSIAEILLKSDYTKNEAASFLSGMLIAVKLMQEGFFGRT